MTRSGPRCNTTVLRLTGSTVLAVALAWSMTFFSSARSANSQPPHSGQCRAGDIVAVRQSGPRAVVWQASSGQFLGGEQWLLEGYPGYGGYTFLSGDVTGDRGKDLIGIQPVPTRFVAWTHQGGAFGPGTTWFERRAPKPDYFFYRFLVGDVNGDQRADVIAIRPTETHAVVWKSTGSAFLPEEEWLTEPPHDYGSYEFRVGDVDGDGKDDVVAIRPRQNRFVVWRSSGVKFHGGEQWLLEPWDYTGYTFHVADVNGDGKADVVAIRPRAARFVVWLNTGTSFEGGREWLSEQWDYSAYEFRTEDVDGDCAADVVAILRNPLRIVTWLSSGGRYAAGREWRLEPKHDYSGYVFPFPRGSLLVDGMVVRGSDPNAIFRLENRAKRRIPNWQTFVSLRLDRDIQTIEDGTIGLLPDGPAYESVPLHSCASRACGLVNQTQCSISCNALTEHAICECVSGFFREDESCRCASGRPPSPDPGPSGAPGRPGPSYVCSQPAPQPEQRSGPSDTVVWMNESWDMVTIEIRRGNDVVPTCNPVHRRVNIRRGREHREACGKEASLFWVRMSPASDGIYIHRPCYGRGDEYREKL
jgi:VCBS repeat protein